MKNQIPIAMKIIQKKKKSIKYNPLLPLLSSSLPKKSQIITFT